MDRIVNRLITVMLTAWVLSGCLDEAGRLALRVTQTSPTSGGDQIATEALRITFDGYLDPTMDFDRAAQLVSSDVVFDAQVGYDPTGPALVVVPRAALRPGLGYRLVVVADVVRGIDGRRLAGDVEVGFFARPAPSVPADPPPPVDFEADLAPILAERCSCHGEEPLAFPPLRPESLIGVAGRADPTLPLVAPGDPLGSGLLVKVLPDYPPTHGLAMPPDGPPLPPAVIRQLVTWIEAL